MLKTIETIFLHHSTGANLINEGKVREILKKKAPHIELWDHGYSYRLPSVNILFSLVYPHIVGLSDEFGRQTGQDYKFHIDNTDVNGYADIFSQQVTDPPTNTLSFILTYDVVIFKSCFPVTKITSDEQLDGYKQNYLIIRKTIDRYPQKLFVLFTPPPLRSEATKPDWAKRAGMFVNWIKSREYVGGRKNIAVFDFFDLLADRSNTLKREYCRFLPFDPHPNKKANQEVVPIFVDSLVKQVDAFFEQ